MVYPLFVKIHLSKLFGGAGGMPPVFAPTVPSDIKEPSSGAFCIFHVIPLSFLTQKNRYWLGYGVARLSTLAPVRYRIYGASRSGDVSQP